MNGPAAPSTATFLSAAGLVLKHFAALSKEDAALPLLWRRIRAAIIVQNSSTVAHTERPQSQPRASNVGRPPALILTAVRDHSLCRPSAKVSRERLETVASHNIQGKTMRREVLCATSDQI